MNASLHLSFLATFVLNLLFFFGCIFFLLHLDKFFISIDCSHDIYIFIWPSNSSWNSSLSAPLLVEYYSCICCFPLIDGKILPSTYPAFSLYLGCSDENLKNDHYLISLMNDHGWVPISAIAEFKRVHFNIY